MSLLFPGVFLTFSWKQPGILDKAINSSGSWNTGQQIAVDLFFSVKWLQYYACPAVSKVVAVRNSNKTTFYMVIIITA